jgi:hypothetical protein
MSEPLELKQKPAKALRIALALEREEGERKEKIAKFEQTNYWRRESIWMIKGLLNGSGPRLSRKAFH